MRVVYMNLVLGAWLLLAAFALGHTPLSAALSVVAAVVIATASLASLGRPAVRYVIAVVAVVLAVFAILLPASAPATINTLVVAALLFALSLVSPRHGPEHDAAHVV